MDVVLVFAGFFLKVSIQETGTFDALFPVSFVVSTVVLDFRVGV